MRCPPERNSKAETRGGGITREAPEKGSHWGKGRKKLVFATRKQDAKQKQGREKDFSFGSAGVRRKRKKDLGNKKRKTIKKNENCRKRQNRSS